MKCFHNMATREWSKTHSTKFYIQIREGRIYSTDSLNRNSRI
jgi:hypothetical protein